MTKKIVRAPEEKKKAILEAAALIVAEQGSTASTALIASKAKVSEGTVFKYFPKKDILLNALYRFLRQKLRAEIPHATEDEPFDEWMRASWTHAIEWGMEHRSYICAMQRLRLSQRLTEETMDESLKIFPEFLNFLESRISADIESKKWQIRLLENFLYNSSTPVVQLASTMKDAQQRQECIQAGFKLFWNGITNF